MTVLDMVRKALAEQGYDGLSNEDACCACVLSDLAPCGEMGQYCEAGYRRDGCHPECGEGCDFHIVSTRETP